MKAVYLDSGRLQYRMDSALPQRKQGEALIRVLLAGVCATDLELQQGYAGFKGILGHEFVGQVEAADDPNWLGKRVVGSINLGCGVCDTCVQQGPEHCATRRVLGIRGKAGAFAEYITLPMANLHAVVDSLSNEQAVFTEPLAAAVRVREQLTHVDYQKVVVLGPGRLGLLVGQVLRDAGKDVLMVGRSVGSLDLPRNMGLRALLVDQAPSGCAVVVDTTGNAQGLDSALGLVRARGTVVLKSSFIEPPKVDLSRVVVNEITLLGSRCGLFPQALELLEDQRVEVKPMIDQVFPLADVEQAFERAAMVGVRKVLLNPSL